MSEENTIQETTQGNTIVGTTNETAQTQAPEPAQVQTQEPAQEPVRELTVEDYNLDWGADIGTDNPVDKQYKDFCLKNKISPEQAQASLEFQKGLMEAAAKDAIESGEKELKNLWGTKYEQKRDASLTALAALDRQMGGRLAPAFKQSGAANDPVIIEALHLVSTMIGEDNLGAGGPGGASSDRPISTEEAYAQLYKQKNKG